MTGNIDDTVISNNGDSEKVLGERNNDWEMFRRNVEYEGFFSAKKKRLILQPLIYTRYESDSRNKRTENSDCSGGQITE
jgi:hypothetical protein